VAPMFARTASESFPLKRLPSDDPVAKQWARENEVFYEGLGLMDWDQYRESISERDRLRAIDQSMCFLCPTSERLFVLASDGTMRVVELAAIASIDVARPPAAIPGRRREGLIRIRANASVEKPELNLVTRWGLALGVADTLNQLARLRNKQPPPQLSEKDAYQKEALKLVRLPAVQAMRKLTQPDEEVFALTKAEKSDNLPVRVLMVVTNRRIIWAYEGNPAGFRDLWFDDIVALALGGVPSLDEADRPLIIEVDDPRYDDLSGEGRTITAGFRFLSPSAQRMLNHVYDQAPEASRGRQPDVEGIGVHRGLGRRRRSISVGSPIFSNVLRDLFERGEWTPSPKLIVPERLDQAGELLPPPPVASWDRCPLCGGTLKPVRDATECLACRRVWCDPEREPELDDTGKLVGARFRFPLEEEVQTGEWRQVTSFIRGPRKESAPFPD
jgi:hypothetical protein